MKKLFLTLALLFTMGLSAQEVDTIVTYNEFKDLYLVKTGQDFHHVTKDGVLHGPFKHTMNNVVIKGSMKDGKRHGTMITIVDGIKKEEVNYNYGKIESYTINLR